MVDRRSLQLLFCTLHFLGKIVSAYLRSKYLALLLVITVAEFIQP